MFIVRNATSKDYESLCALFAKANFEHLKMRPDLYRPVKICIPEFKFQAALFLRDKFNYQPVMLKVAELDNEVIGSVFVQSLSRSTLSWSAFEKEAYLDNIVVDENHRRQGIGTALLRAAKTWTRETGHYHMWGKILDANNASLAFFKKANFTADSTNVGMHIG
ncbi:MAG: GNAT family N-acetyltransferase [Alphaproteobacteria bacterium PRO2]|nr:GNAT family N-acetyltransferase [Alphaproteobacteria bacterium PRO2]